MRGKYRGGKEPFPKIKKGSFDDSDAQNKKNFLFDNLFYELK